MELQSPVAAKNLWNFLRLAIIMMRKGLIAKRKLIMDMKLVMERGKVLGKSLGNLMFHHQPRSPLPQGPNFSMHAYEFSCTNTPNPILYGMSWKRRHNLFSCIHANVVEEPDEMPGPVAVLPMIERSPQWAYSPSVLAIGEQRSQMPSPFSVRVSNYSSEDEGDGFGREVDDKAEEFIKRFYEQLRSQSRIAMLQYEEK
ncbi:uncharacterized protein LOC103713298 [Phoenix dactylifera]|uniref:Uncharacterized protein LOC103713298 n=1 Tax=Phoenix dactylifera TaxID=42345 RepID=A0A8B7CFZ1_PHODC|nr:uncharacterized protein LOC103713298 [Phoenix dactylifera]